jgi:hypothetical protein
MKKGGDRLNPAIYVPIILLWILIFGMIRGRRKAIAVRRIMEKKRKGGNANMRELAKEFIGKECIINSFDGSHQYVGTLKEVTDGAILIENGGALEAINLDFVIRIREYPRNKKGKKKSVIFD